MRVAESEPEPEPKPKPQPPLPANGPSGSLKLPRAGHPDDVAPQNPHTTVCWQRSPNWGGRWWCNWNSCDW